jgi:hypothetical protein
MSNVDSNELKEKILGFYPELEKYSVEMDVEFDEDRKVWAVTVKKGPNQLTTYVEPEDAKKCLEGVECVYLGHQIGQFVRIYCEGGDACET